MMMEKVMTKMNDQRQKLLELAKQKFGNQLVKRKEFQQFAEFENGFSYLDMRTVLNSVERVGHGQYRFGTTADFVAAPKVTRKTKTVAKTAEPVAAAPQPQMTAQVIPMRNKFDPNATSEHDHAAVPDRDPLYIPFGDFNDIEKIIASGDFFPVFISGLSGNGKTFMVQQACARTKRSMIRVQMSRETDEDDLIGGFRLINGETKFLKGPVLRAMELGALLLIDEADRADPGKIMCLQGILEGNPYYVKKTGEIITPKHGFNVIVTANTKGKGSDDGRYVAATVLDDSWLERFPITIEQEYPRAAIESRILTKFLESRRAATESDTSFIRNLIAWAEITRKTFEEGAIDESITTRRLVHIMKTYLLFNDKMRALTLCVNRFDKETRNSFLELYTKVDADPNLVSPTQAAANTAATSTVNPPF